MLQEDVQYQFICWNGKLIMATKQVLDANGFNGNENEKTIKYTYGIISKIRKLLMIK